LKVQPIISSKKLVKDRYYNHVNVIFLYIHQAGFLIYYLNHNLHKKLNRLNNNIETRPIIWIDDDKEDLELFENVFKSLRLKNPIIKITESDKALQFLKEFPEQPFVIICDINMPKISGIDLRKAMLADTLLKIKSIPFIFFSTSAAPSVVLKSYDLSVQGYFVKPTNLDGIKKLLNTIIDYWAVCQHPNLNEIFY